MDLQTIQYFYYLLGSIFFIVMIMFLIVVIIGFFMVKKRLAEISDDVHHTYTNVKNIFNHKEAFVSALVQKGTSSVLDNISSLFRKRKQKS